MALTDAQHASIKGILLSRVGRANAIRGCEVVAILRAAGIRIHLRRVSESVQRLRQEGVPILSTSSRGYYAADTDDERAEAAAELRKRIAALNRSLVHLDAACAQRIQLALSLGGAA